MLIDNKLIENVELNSEMLDEVVDKVCEPYLKELNSYIDNLKQIASDDKYTDLSLSELSQSLVFISGSLYSLVGAINKVALRSSVATALKDEAYSKHYNSEGNTGTISDKKSKALLAVTNETVIETVYKNCYNRLKTSYEAGQECYGGLKKICNIRVSEANLTNMQR